MPFKDILLKARKYTIKHSPEILTGIGIASMFSSTILAIKSTPKARTLILEYEEQKEANHEYTELVENENYGVYKSNMLEKVKVTWKEYVPSILLGVSGAACIIGANRINTKRNAVLTAAYAISETTLSKYRDKVIDRLGTSEEKAIRKEVATEVKENKTVNKNIEKADFKVVDGYSGLEMPKGITFNDVEKVVNKLNKTMNFDDYVNLCDWYDELGFKNIPKCAENTGWRLDVTGLIEIEKEASLNELDEPVLVINFITKPMQAIDNWG